MSRLPDGVRPRTGGSLSQRTEQIVRLFDAETNDYAFGDSGDAEMYAAEMADLLEQWTEATSPKYYPIDQRPPGS